MIYTKEVENMCPVAKGAKHEPAPIPEEGKWVHSKKIEDISGFPRRWTTVSPPMRNARFFPSCACVRAMEASMLPASRASQQRQSVSIIGS